MKLRSKEPYWLLKNGLIQSYPSLRQNINCDILIIGGGITGALMAYQFAQEGYMTTLVEKRDLSLGSTCATTALLQYEIDEPLHTLIDKAGLAAALDSYREGVKAIRKLGELVKTLNLEADFSKRDSLYIARDSRQLKIMEREFEARTSAGLEVTWLSKQLLADTYQVEGRGAILSRDAGCVDGYKLAHGLCHYATRHHHLKVFDHTEILHVSHDGVKNVASTEEGYKINCQYVIYTTGYESQAMLKEKVVDLISTYACVSEPLTQIPEPIVDTILWDMNDPYLYVRTTPDNRILVGGADEQFRDPERRDKKIPRKELVIVENFKKLVKGIDFIPDFTWAGTFGVTKDSLPYIGPHPDYPQSYFVLGFGGNGITFSIMGMQIISDAIAGRENPFLHHFRFGR